MILWGILKESSLFCRNSSSSSKESVIKVIIVADFAVSLVTKKVVYFAECYSLLLHR